MKIGLFRYCAFPPLCRALRAILMDLMSIPVAVLLLRAEKTLATRIKPIFAVMGASSRSAMTQFANRCQFPLFRIAFR